VLRVKAALEVATYLDSINDIYGTKVGGIGSVFNFLHFCLRLDCFILTCLPLRPIILVMLYYRRNNEKFRSYGNVV
jgi:hypothetical protein